MKKLILLFLLLSTMVVAQDVNIPDTTFKAYLVGKSYINTNGDDEIQLSEAEVIDSIYFSNSLILDLTGIEAFTALRTLTFNYNNEITSIDLSKNQALSNIWIVPKTLLPALTFLPI
ncbi:MAG: hypothetical protein HRT71_04580 [Flavobacteriales bacterium]|nr:hypothetical protein [Flavobacteriales bacterium]